MIDFLVEHSDFIIFMAFLGVASIAYIFGKANERNATHQQLISAYRESELLRELLHTEMNRKSVENIPTPLAYRMSRSTLTVSRGGN